MFVKKECSMRCINCCNFKIVDLAETQGVCTKINGEEVTISRDFGCVRFTAIAYAKTDVFDNHWQMKTDTNKCYCHSCMSIRKEIPSRMIVCNKCGNKRCPKAEYHAFKCTDSNATNQTGELE